MIKRNLHKLVKKSIGHNFDGFSVIVYPDEDNIFVAYLGELPNVSAFGNTFDNAVNELSVAWALIKAAYDAHHQPLPKPC